ncbi:MULTISPECIES: 3-deoxy-7-phosphoheptulonate synthase [Dickeya]|uniref:Phospho-2-dehydro-3-deoxyheptonate aldolase n=1 Tax=Dickeya aquatica TaxID=1401087 RepID=A0A375A9G9_9GAMM|nr:MULTISPECIES: 3-deoxy-7-phosphoheptulonate synthase [Dickeya]SLM62744.1 2-keto-3-deoxy-D-arabino-heptulosonate-7-phosphate synthase I alpha [Dickeya aquatica]
MSTLNILPQSSFEDEDAIVPYYKQHYFYRRPNNILHEREIISPQELIRKFPLSLSSHNFVSQSRKTIVDILNGRDPRLLVIVGPCSIHNLDAAREYGEKLKLLSDKVSESFFIVMRNYFEKPRTTVGWQGLINDPYMDNSFCIEDGLILARKLLSELSSIGLPTAIEALDTLIPKYLQDLVSWTAVGARTTESQPHRKFASSLDCAVGFKNSTDGSVDAAVNSIIASKVGGHFLNINENGNLVVTTSQGNPHAHIILRGGANGPNYSAEHIINVEATLYKKMLPDCIVVDCSHDNSAKNPSNQLVVVNDVKQQILSGNKSIKGIMLESNLQWGNQCIGDDLSAILPGLSVTDACIDWQTTEDLLLKLKDSLQFSLLNRFRLQNSKHSD